MLITAIQGCSKEEPVAPTLPPQVTRGSGSISGTVTLLSKPPEMKSRPVTCDPGAGKPKILWTDRTVRTGANGGLADVYVFVKNGPVGGGKGEPPVVLDQINCAFEPHALGVQIGQTIILKNSDPAFHNVHWDKTKNRPQNISFRPAPVAEMPIALGTSEFVHIRCDVHDWMKSTIGVFDNPFFAVTDADGRFEIKRLPPGTWTVTTWHPFYGAGEEKQIVIAPDEKPVSASFSYK